MADIRPVTDAFAVAPQIRPEELAELGRGFTTVINNRPDGEELGQPSAAEIEAAARAAGLTYVHIPVSGAPTADQTHRMHAALAASDGPALAFCKSGTRSIIAWAVGEAAAGRPVEEVAEAAQGAGYEVGPQIAAVLARLGPA